MASQDELQSSTQAWGGSSNIVENTESSSPEQPPAYSGSAASNVSESPVRRAQSALTPDYNPLRALSELAKIPLYRYDIGASENSTTPDKTTVTITQMNLYSNASALLGFILDQAALPPKPMLRIHGSHADHVGGRNTVDFDLVLNLTHLLDWSQHQTNVRSARYTPISGGEKSMGSGSGSSFASESTIATSVKQFCNDRSENKSYTFTRRIANMPVEILEGQIRSLLAALKYRGQLVVSFPVERSKITIHKQQNWLFNVLKLYPERKYSVLETVWSLASAGGSDPDRQLDASANAAHVAKQWWASWAPTIRNAILAKRVGYVGVDDWIDAKMGESQESRLVDWGRDYSG